MISCITTTYDELELTKRHLDSLISKTPLLSELIVVDSPHAYWDILPAEGNIQTRKWLEKFVEQKSIYKLVKLDKPWWHGVVANRGIRACNPKNKYIIYINNDVFLTSNWLEPLIDAMEKDESIGWISPMIYNEEAVSCMGCNFTDEPWIIFDPNKVNEPIPVTYTMGCLMVMRREAVFDVGLYDEKQIDILPEVDFALSLWKKEWKVMIHPKSKVLHLGRYTKKRHRTWEPTISWKEIVEYHGFEWLGENYFWTKHSKEEIKELTQKLISIQSKIGCRWEKK